MEAGIGHWVAANGSTRIMSLVIMQLMRATLLSNHKRLVRVMSNFSHCIDLDSKLYCSPTIPPCTGRARPTFILPPHNILHLHA